MPKMKWHSMRWSQQTSVILTEKQWAKITRSVKLPIEARADLSECISLYRLFVASDQNRPSPSVVTKELERLEKIAVYLIQELNMMSADARYILMDLLSSHNKREAIIMLESRIKAIDHLADEISAATVYSKKNKKRPGTDSAHLDWLMRQIDAILYRYTEANLSRRKPQLDYAIAVCAVADPKIKNGSIEAAIKRRIKIR